MNNNADVIAQMRAITVSREYGSGGGEIAARLAARLAWQLIDHEVIVRVARDLNVSEAEVELHDEHVGDFVSRLLTAIQAIQPAMPVVGPVAEITFDTDPKIYQDAISRVVKAAVTTGHVVIVGRGSQVLLANRRDVLHVRVVAPLEARIAYVMQRERLGQDTARDRIKWKDSSRIRYLQTVHHKSPEDPHLYDLVVNTAVLGLESTVDLICLALERKAQRLSISTGELGPATGLPPYAGQPADFRPSQPSEPETTR